MAALAENGLRVLPAGLADEVAVMGAALKEISRGGGGWSLAQIAQKALETGECPHGCRGTGWIGAGNSWGDTAALPCPIHSSQLGAGE